MSEVRPRYKHTEVGVIPEDWEVSRLQDVCRVPISYGIVQCGAHFRDGIPYVRVSDMDKPELDVEGMLRTSPAIAARFPRSTVHEGDLVYALRGKLGEVRRVSSSVAGANLTQGTARLSPSDGILSVYLMWGMRSPRVVRQAEIESKGTTFREITLADLRGICLSVPPLPEQTAIAEALSDADALIEFLEQLLTKKRQIKQGAMQELLTGKKRLPGFQSKPGYKQTEVGPIPEDWRLATLGEMCAFENGDRSSNYPAPNSFVASGIPFVNAGHVAEGRINLAEMNYISETAYARLGGGKVKPGDILFCLRGSLGKFGIVSAAFGDGAIASSLVIVRPRMTSLDRDYLSCYFGSDLCTRMIKNWSGGAAQPNLGAQDLARFLIPLATSKSEQAAVASVLSDMDSELSALETKLVKARQLKQGMMQELLTGRIRLV